MATQLTAPKRGRIDIVAGALIAIAGVAAPSGLQAQQPTLEQLGEDYFSDSPSHASVKRTGGKNTKRIPSKSGTVGKPQLEGRSDEVLSLASSPLLSAWVQQIVLRNLPKKYVDEKKWGKTKEVFDGLKFEREGLKIETRRRKKLVNHGKWLRYEASVFSPANENFTISIENTKVKEGGIVSFDLVARGKFQLFGRFARWVNGVQLVSVSVNSTATTVAVLSCETVIDFRISPRIQVVFKPKVLSAKLSLLDYDVERISYLRGEVAEAIGKLFEQRISSEISEYATKLPKKINEELTKQAPKLVFPN